MTLLDSIKPFWPLLFTIGLPRALGYYNALKTAYRTRPPPTPLPPGIDRSLNILFCSILFFLIQSYPRSPERDVWNIFSATSTRFGAPADVLFTRLAMLRPNTMLTATDEALRNVLLTKEARYIYLTVGPSALLSCPFCHFSRLSTYTLYALPTTILLPHLIHLTILGLATSGALTSHITSRFRTKLLIPALVLLAMDLYIILAATFMPAAVLAIGTQPPQSVYVWLRALRPLSFCAVDAGIAFYIWATCTNRFIFFPFLSNPNSSASLESLQVQTQDLVRNSGISLQNTQAKLRALNIARNTVVRDGGLKAREEEYWTEVREVEGGDEEVYQDEEVQAAIARVYGQGGIDVPRARKEAGAFVDGVTRGLEASAPGSE
ncbi:hypothetical protein LTS08_002897 [Lithohypha guttulata]|nr:hypothetical protein LTS08_002897 [Lithohypha guttulata]